MSRTVAPNKPFLNGSGQSYSIRQVYFRFQCHGTAIDKRSLVLQGRSVQGTGCRCASPCACKKSKRPTTSYLSTCWVACRVTCWVLVGYLLGQGTKKSELWGNFDAYVSGNAKQFLRLSPKIERNAKQYLTRRKKWALFCVSYHLGSRWTNYLAFISTFDGCWCFYLAFLATFNLCWRYRRTFLVILGFNEGLVLRFFSTFKC